MLKMMLSYLLASRQFVAKLSSYLKELSDHEQWGPAVKQKPAPLGRHRDLSLI